MALILPFRPNKLAFPGGLPGINTAHPASQNLYLSAVAAFASAGSSPAPSGFTNLTNGAALIRLGAGTNPGSIFSIDGAIGPAQTSNASANSIYGINISLTSAQGAAKTVANIFRFSVQGGAGIYQGMLTFGGSEGFWILNGAPNYFIGSDNVPSGITFTVGHAYFVAICARNVGANILITYVVKNLTTGLVQSGSVTHAGSSLSAVATVYVGNDNTSETSLNPIAAAMYSGAPLSLRQLEQWANDPWSFWYPPQLDLSMLLKPTVVVAPTTKAGTLPLMGVG